MYESIGLCKCSGKVLIRYDKFSPSQKAHFLSYAHGSERKCKKESIMVV